MEELAGFKPTAFTMPENFISLEEAIRLTGFYREMKDLILNDAYKGKDVLPQCETFSRDAFDAVLAQSGCESVRVYFGMDDNFQIKAVIVGVDANGVDMLPKEANDEGNNIIENGKRCPTDCPPPSPLNP